MTDAAAVTVPTRPALLDGEPVVGQPTRLAASRCESCGRTEFPRRSRCVLCGDQMTDVSLGPNARVLRHTSVEHQPPGALITAPYVVVAAAYEEGIAVLGVVLDATADEVNVDDRLLTVATTVGDDTVFAYRLQRGGE